MDDRLARDKVARIESLLEHLESVSDPDARATATKTVQALLELYGEGLARILACAESCGAAELAESLAADELVAHLLLLHGLHPVPVEVRVGQALAEVRPYLRSHGGNVELLRVADGVAHLRLQGSCSGCPSSTMTLRLAIEEAIQRAAPDLERVEAEGATEPAPVQFVPITPRGNGASSAVERDGWVAAGSLPQLTSGGTLLHSVAGEPVLFLKLHETFYAYRPTCPACEQSLAEATLEQATLACPHCGRRYDVHRAGRCLDAPRLHLEPLPLLVTEAGVVEVALPAGVR